MCGENFVGSAKVVPLWMKRDKKKGSEGFSVGGFHKHQLIFFCFVLGHSAHVLRIQSKPISFGLEWRCWANLDHLWPMLELEIQDASIPPTLGPCWAYVGP